MWMLRSIHDRPQGKTKDDESYEHIAERAARRLSDLSRQRPPAGVRDYDARRSPGVAAAPHRLRARKPINDQSSQRVDLEPVRQQDRFHEPAGVACKQSKSTALFGGQSHRFDRLMLKRQRSRKKKLTYGAVLVDLRA